MDTIMEQDVVQLNVISWVGSIKPGQHYPTLDKELCGTEAQNTPGCDSD